MSNKTWQDETVQALKKGYLSTIDDLQTRLDAVIDERNNIEVDRHETEKKLTALKTASSNVTVQLNKTIDPADEPHIVIDRKDIIALAALLGETK